MKSTNYLACILILLFTACSSYETTQEEHPLYSIDQFYENEQIYGGSFSHDGEQLLVTSKATGILNAHALATDGSANIALTESTTESAIAVSFFPKDNRILYRMDEGGNENNRLILLDESGNSKDLVTGDSIRNQFGGWSRDLERMYYLSNKRDKRFMDMYQMSIASMDEELPIGELIYQNNDGLNIGSISTNERYYVLTRANTSADNDMYLYDRETDETISLSDQEEDALFSPQFFDLEDKYLYYTTDLNNEYTYLARYSMEDGSIEKVFETDWDVWYAYESYNGKYRVIGVNEDARTKLYLTDQTTDEKVNLPDVNGDITSVSISRDEKRIRLTVSASTSPSNIYVYNFESQELTKLTDTLNPDLDESSLVIAEVVRFKSFDGLEIPAIYYQPKTASTYNKVPALIWVHGGPGGQSRTGYFSLIQYLANQGYAILAVNNRGSSGYGKTFNQMDNQNHGDKDLKDCIAGKSFFESTGVIDMEKIGIIGASYGGYMTMAALTFAPEEFNVGVNIFGVTNWLRTLKGIPPHWESFKKSLYDEMGDPNTEDSVRLYEISPLFHTQRVTKPLMVLQGANDIRVIQAESDEIVAGVRANGVPVEYVLFDDEGHGFRKRENEISGYGQIKAFLDKYLKGEEETEDDTDESVTDD